MKDNLDQLLKSSFQDYEADKWVTKSEGPSAEGGWCEREGCSNLGGFLCQDIQKNCVRSSSLGWNPVNVVMERGSPTAARDVLPPRKHCKRIPRLACICWSGMKHHLKTHIHACQGVQMKLKLFLPLWSLWLHLCKKAHTHSTQKV